jgi:hypothetical protein
MIIKPSLAEVLSVNYRQHPRYRGCVGHWLMNEGGGSTLYDFSGQGRNAAIINSVPWAHGGANIGPALNFNGSTHHCVVPSFNVSSTTQGGLSITAWFKFSSYGVVADQDIICRKGTTYSSSQTVWALEIQDSAIRFFPSDNGALPGVDGPADLVVNTLYFAAGTFDGTVVKCFRDGKELASETGSVGGVAQSSNNIHIGARPDGLDASIGYIYEIRIYDRGLTPGEVMSMYQDPFLEFIDQDDEEDDKELFMLLQEEEAALVRRPWSWI